LRALSFFALFKVMVLALFWTMNSTEFSAVDILLSAHFERVVEPFTDSTLEEENISKEFQLIC
jgi:hypothetical protein